MSTKSDNDDAGSVKQVMELVSPVGFYVGITHIQCDVAATYECQLHDEVFGSVYE